MSKIIGVTGGKGGTGKSTIATALAIEIGKKFKVLLADVDVDCPNDHIILNIKRKIVKKVYQRIPKWDLSKCVRCGRCGGVCETNAVLSIKEKLPIFMQSQCNGCGACVLECPVKAIEWSKKEVGKIYNGKSASIDFISGELKLKEPLSEFVVNAVLKEVQKLKRRYDLIILDTAAGTHCNVISAVSVCDLAFAVTEPTPLGLHDLELIMKLLSQLNVRFEIILNKWETKKESIIANALKPHKKQIFERVPYKKSIIKAYSEGTPVKEKSIIRIATAIEGWLK